MLVNNEFLEHFKIKVGNNIRHSIFQRFRFFHSETLMFKAAVEFVLAACSWDSMGCSIHDQEQEEQQSFLLIPAGSLSTRLETAGLLTLPHGLNFSAWVIGCFTLRLTECGQTVKS